MRKHHVLIIASTLLISLFAPAAQAVANELFIRICMDKSIKERSKEFHVILYVTQGTESKKDYPFTYPCIDIEDKTTAVSWYSWNYSHYSWTLSIFESGDLTSKICSYDIGFGTRVWEFWSQDSCCHSVHVTKTDNKNYECRLDLSRGSSSSYDVRITILKIAHDVSP